VDAAFELLVSVHLRRRDAATLREVPKCRGGAGVVFFEAIHLLIVISHASPPNKLSRIPFFLSGPSFSAPALQQLRHPVEAFRDLLVRGNFREELAAVDGRDHGRVVVGTEKKTGVFMIPLDALFGSRRSEGSD